MQHAEQIRLRPLGGPEAAGAQLAIDRDQRDQHETDRGEMAEAGEVVGPVRIHQRLDLRQFIAALMMIDHDDRHPEPPRFVQRLEAGGAAIDRHQQRRALAGEHADGLDIGAVAFKNPVGNVDQGIEPAMAQVPGEQRRRRRAVDVVIAEDRDFFAARSRIRDPLRRGFHLRHGVGIGHHLADGRDRESPRPRRSRRRARPAPAPASPAIGSAARSPAPVPRPAHRAGRATAFRSRNATRRETPWAVRQAMRMRGAP